MINQTKKMLSALLVGILLLSGCNNTITDETDTTETILETEVSTEVPELTPAKHEISVEEVESLLIANGLQTNIHSKSPYPAVHSGQQMRVVHTERGTYTAFCRDFGHETGIGQFIVAKIDNDNNVTLLYFGEHRAEGSVPVNIAQNTNGDIIVMAAAAHIPGQKYETTTPDLAIYIFDAETDAMTSYTANMVVGDSAGEGECLVSGESWLGYSEAYFDFENQKIYAFFDGGDFTSDFLLEWFTFDLVTKQWATTSTYKWFEGIGRHGYFFIFPDENGGVYIVANQNAPIQVTDGLLNYLGSPGSHEKYSNYEYVFGTITLFHIPDLTSSENITYTPVQEPYSERGQEGIWSDMQCITYGGAFMDADGYLHITYRYFLTDFLSDKPGLYVLDNPKYDPDLQYRHAIFDGMECIYNEKMDIEDTDWQYLKPQITQSTDGTLYMIVNKDQSRPIQVKVYKAEDALGKTWTLESVNTLDEEKYLRNFSISQARNGSTQDNTVSCFTYGMYGGYDVLEDKRINHKTGFTFNISLDDYSTTELVDILEGYDIYYDERVDNRAHNTAHQTKVVHTENGTYAAFVYDYIYDDDAEYFHIVKIDNEKNVTVLYSGSYTSKQDKYMTMQMLPDGKIYVCPPTGYTVYTIDPATDAVTLVETAEYTERFDIIEQADLLPHAESGKTYLLCDVDNFFRIGAYTLDTEAMTLSRSAKNTSFDTKLLGDYSKFYTISDGGSGAYIVATRKLFKQAFVTDQKEIGEKFKINGHTNHIEDSVVLFYMPNIADGKTTCVEVQAPYEAEGNEGIWSVVNVADNGDVYLDSEGKLHVFYSYYHYDFDDADGPKNPELIASTLKHYHAVYEGSTLISNEELGIEGLTKDTSIRMAETTDGTPYLLVCNLNELNAAKIDVYSETEDGWVLSQTKDLGEFTAESFSISGPRGGSVQDNTVDCLIYAWNNDVYYTSVTFE